jgi:Uncharacterized protein conserved in bacteria (DUF2334)
MRYVILRDDDTNALTPPECLETLYRPFLERDLPVNLAVIPEVRTTVRLPDGKPEGFLMARTGKEAETVPMAEGAGMLAYLKANTGYRVVQHGCHHDYHEFGGLNRAEAVRRLDHGAQRLMEAGLGRSGVFVAPYDLFSKTALQTTAERYDVVSTCWYHLQGIPRVWWPRYALSVLRKQPHWRTGKSLMLSHPGCLLSYRKPVGTMLEEIKRRVRSQAVTVLVTHWWEYFAGGKTNQAFVDVLHRTADYLAGEPEVRVVSFQDAAEGRVPVE